MQPWSKNEQLCELAKQGNKKAIEQLYQNNIGIIKRYCRSFAKNSVEYEDLTQEAYFVLNNSVKNFNPELGFKFITYFSLSLKHRFIRSIKQIRSKDLLVLNQSAGDCENDDLIEFIADENAIDPQEKSEKSLFQEMVQAELNKLQGDTKKVLVLHYLEGFTVEQIGQILGVSIYKVSSALTYGRKMLLKNSNLRKLYQSWFNVRETELLRKKLY